VTSFAENAWFFTNPVALSDNHATKKIPKTAASAMISSDANLYAPVGL
jgi:hypothetical protein